MSEPTYKHRMRCRLEWHRWAKWEHFCKGTLSNWIGKRPATIQQRICMDCGKHEQKIVEMTGL